MPLQSSSANFATALLPFKGESLKKIFNKEIVYTMVCPPQYLKYTVKETAKSLLMLSSFL